MEPYIRELLKSKLQGVFAVTGGGVGGLFELLRYGGASSFVLESIVPYATESFVKFVKATPEKFSSEEAARMLATQAFARAVELTKKPGLFGVGLSCTLARHENERPGRVHKVYAAYQTDTQAASYTFLLKPDSRVNQEDVAAKLLLFVTAEAAVGTNALINEPLTKELKDTFESFKKVTYDRYGELIRGETLLDFWAGDHVCSHVALPADIRPVLLIPGSFNPLHDGHLTMAKIGREMLGLQVVFELAICNVDKPTLDAHEIVRRKQQFHDAKLNLAITCAPNFLQKARLFPGCTFAVGMDTWARFNNPSYHGHKDAHVRLNDRIHALEQAREELKAQGCKFLVFGRKIGDDFKTLEAGDELAIPVPADKFRVDTSSTELRTLLKSR